MKSWTIVGYQYNADIYCRDCIIRAMAQHGVDVFGLSLDSRLQSTHPELALDTLAREMGIDHQDQRSYDSGDFPKVVFADQAQDDDRCGDCCRILIR